MISASLLPKKNPSALIGLSHRARSQMVTEFAELAARMMTAVGLAASRLVCYEELRELSSVVVSCAAV